MSDGSSESIYCTTKSNGKDKGISLSGSYAYGSLIKNNMTYIDWNSMWTHGTIDPTVP